MFRIIDRYLLKELLGPFAIGVGVFTFFLFIGRMYQLTDLVIAKRVPFRLVLFLLMYMFPAFLALTVPMALLLAVLLACGRLSGDLEVIALNSSGVSSLRLLRPFLAAGVVVTLAIAWLTLVAAPHSITAIESQMLQILKTRASSGIQERTFSASFGGLVIYVEEVSPSQLALTGVLVADERDPALSRIILAREGRLLTDEVLRRVTLRFIDGSINETDTADPKRFRYTGFSLYDMTLPLESSLSRAAEPEKPEKSLSVRNLIERAGAIEDPKAAAPYWVELHKRLALPMAALVFVVVGFALGVRSHRAGRAVAFTASFAIMATYYILINSLEGLALNRRLPIGLAIWLPNLVFLGVGVGLMRMTAIGITSAWDRLARLMTKLPRGRPGWIVWPQWASRAGRPRGPRASGYIIDRYLLRQYLFFLGIGCFVGMVLILIVDILQSLDRILRLKPPLTYIAQHFLYLVPRELYQALPIIVLVSTVFLFLTLSRQREIDGLKASGVSLYRISAPVLALAMCISLGALIFQEALLPGIAAKGEEVDRVKIRGLRPRHLQQQGQIWYHLSDTRFIHIALLDPAQQSLDGLLVLNIDRNFRLLDRLDSSAAQWTDKGWRLKQGFVRSVDTAGRVRSERFEQRIVDMPEQIHDLTQVQRRPESMSFLDLRSYVKQLRDSGHPVGGYLVDLYAKLSFPLVHVIMALVAIPFALVSPRDSGRAVGFGLAIAIAVSYWVVHSIALSFGRADLLPAALAAWTANIIFFGLGGALFFHART